MNKIMTLPTWFLLLMVSASLTATFVGAQEDPVRLFDRGKRLIERNCGDCEGGTKDGLQAGIDDVIRSIEAGYFDKGKALRLVAQAYGTMAIVYIPHKSPEESMVLTRRKEIYSELISLKPRDADVRFEYAQALMQTEGDERTQIHAF